MSSIVLNLLRECRQTQLGLAPKLWLSGVKIEINFAWNINEIIFFSIQQCDNFDVSKFCIFISSVVYMPRSP